MKIRAAVAFEIGGGFTSEDVEIDSPVGAEVLVAVRASGLCRSDLHLVEKDYGYEFPAVFGHEVAGVVQEVGPDVRTTHVGDHVVVTSIRSCARCGACRRGRSYACDNRTETLRGPGERARLSIDGSPLLQAFGIGGFADHVLTHERQLAVVPRELPFEQASVLACATVTGAGSAINGAGITLGDSVAVLGAGGVGLNILSGARIAGATRIIAVDVDPRKLARAKRFGATASIDARGIDVVEAVHQMTGGGVDHAFDAVGAPDQSTQAVRMTRRGGSAFLIGLHNPGDRLDLDPLHDLIYAQRRVQGVLMGMTDVQRDIPAYAELALQRRLNLADLVTGTTSLAGIDEAYRRLVDGDAIRTVITEF